MKRTDELSRKMRFFTDQVEKSGVIPGARSGAVDTLNMDELEVCAIVILPLKSCQAYTATLAVNTLYFKNDYCTCKTY